MKQRILAILAILGIGTTSMLGYGFSSNRGFLNRETTSTLTTTEVTTTTIKTIALSNPTSTTQIVVNVVANGVGDATTSTYGGGWHCNAVYKNVSSTVTQIGTTTCDSNASSGLGFEMVTSTGSVLLKVNGLTSSTFHWEAFTEVYSVL
jgi:hypothetical protein